MMWVCGRVRNRMSHTTTFPPAHSDGHEAQQGRMSAQAKCSRAPAACRSPSATVTTSRMLTGQMGCRCVARTCANDVGLRPRTKPNVAHHRAVDAHRASSTGDLLIGEAISPRPTVRRPGYTSLSA